MAENTQATQQDIESWLWDSANILRGPVDPANLRDFVFPLLFLKRLSDTWDEEQEKAIKMCIVINFLNIANSQKKLYQPNWHSTRAAFALAPQSFD